MSKLDRLYRNLVISKFFVKGWGNPENIKRIFDFRKIMSNRETCRHLVKSDHPIVIEKTTQESDCTILEGHFLSPFAHYLPEVMPKEVQKASFQVILPRAEKWKGKLKPMCIHLAGTGDHSFIGRRKLMAKPLLKDSGIGSILLENPYYGSRKPAGQFRSRLHNVSDLFVMGGALILESLALFHWCERQGWGPLGITGVSMGGHMASLAATNWHKPISLVPCLSWSTASTVFTEGVMSRSIPWKLLQEQYLNNRVYEDEISKLIVSPEENRFNAAFQLGKQFAEEFPQNLSETETLEENKKDSTPDLCESQTSNPDMPTGIPSKGIKCTSTSDEKPQPANQYTSSRAYSKQSSSRDNTGSTPTSSAGKNITSWKESIANKFRWSKSSHKQSDEVVDFMRGMMDECTHLGNYSVPLDPSLIILVQAKDDAYYPRSKVLPLDKIWQGSEVRYVNAGHISAILLNQESFRLAIKDSFQRQTEKYYSDQL